MQKVTSNKVNDEKASHTGTSENYQGEAALISDEVKEIISYRPHWIIRKGNIIFLIVLLLLLSLTWVISYPDVVTGKARLVALNAPKLVISKNEGKLEKLFVVNEQQVQAGQPLAYLQTTASHEQVIKLSEWVNKIIAATKDQDLSAVEKFPLPPLIQLGELQPVYQEFQNVLFETKQIFRSGYYQKKKATLHRDLQYLAQLKNTTYEQKKLVEQDKQLQKKEYEAYESLAKDKVIAPLELNQYKSKLLGKEQSIEQINTQLTTSDLTSHNKRKELLDLDKQVLDQGQKFHSVLLNLKSEIEKWMQQYIVMAPESGKVFFINSLQENELLANGQELFYIQSTQSKFYCDLMVGQNGMGKLAQGQKVLLKTESYPSTQYGHIVGTISYISNLPSRRDSFLIKVDLPNGLRTNYNKEIFFRNNLSATADIITDDRKLFDRLLGNLKDILKR